MMYIINVPSGQGAGYVVSHKQDGHKLVVKD